jgi:triphosphatase
MSPDVRTPPKELELKLELAPASLSKLKTIPLLRALKLPPRRTNEVSVYFDTNKHKLRRNGLTLRVRRIGERCVQTIKAAADSGLFERDEWETEIAGEKPDLSLAKGTALEQLLNNRLHRQLKPLFETRVQRTVYQVTDDTRAIALTIDRGTIDTGRRSAPLSEIELEHQRGSVEELFDVAREIIRTIPAQLATKSKSERGYELIDGEQGAPVKAAHIALHEGSNTRDALKTIGRACLKQVICNEPALLNADPEGVHQMRVGLRRLRAAMSLFAALLDDPQTAAIKAELKWLTGELGPARELDVLVSHVMPIKDRKMRGGGVRSVSHELAEQREAALARAHNAVQSSRFRALTLEVAAWLEAGQWTTSRDDLARDRGDLPITVFAAEQLSHGWRQVRKKGRMLAKLAPRRRHKLRIQAKKLRYAVEFFANVFTRKRAAKRREQLLPALERLQDALGDLNDIAVHEERIAAVGMGRRRRSPNRAFAAGLLAGREDARVATAMTAATQAYSELADIKPFWS